MNVSRRVKLLVVATLIVGAAVYLALLDYGLNAGRIHYGVHVRGVNVGGLTVQEAVGVLKTNGRRLQSAPVVFSAEGMECSFVPDDLGWRPKPKTTSERARDVGFTGGLLEAVGDRLRAYFTGVELQWEGATSERKVDALIADCDEQADALGLELNEPELKARIERAIVTWPRQIFEVPVSR